MGFWDKERAQEAYDRKPVGNINKMMSSSNFTKYDELKVSDHRLSYELKRIADTLEELVNILDRQ